VVKPNKYDSVAEQVYGEVAETLTTRFSDEGVAIAVTQGVYNVSAVRGYVWAKGAKQLAALPAAQRRLLKITVLDSIGAACAEKGDAVGLGIALGAQELIDAKVKETVEKKLSRGMAAEGVAVLLIPL
jgi:hypothetical protein